MNFKNSIADPMGKESYVEVTHLGQTYYGKAKCHPDDEWSNFTGCRLAEMRANIKALKAEYKMRKQSCEECRKFVVAVMQYKNFDKSAPSAKAMFRQLNRRIAEVNRLADQITKAEFDLNIMISRKNMINERINQKRLNEASEN